MCFQAACRSAALQIRPQTLRLKQHLMSKPSHWFHVFASLDRLSFYRSASLLSFNNPAGATVANSPTPCFHFSRCGRTLSGSVYPKQPTADRFSIPHSDHNERCSHTDRHARLTCYLVAVQLAPSRAGGTAVKMGQCQARTPSATRSAVWPPSPAGAAAAGDHPQSVRRVQPGGRRRRGAGEQRAASGTLPGRGASQTSEDDGERRGGPERGVQQHGEHASRGETKRRGCV